MTTAVLILVSVAFGASALGAQSSKDASSRKTPSAAAGARTAASSDTTDDADDPEEPRFQYGIAGGALSYSAGRSEQSFGAVLRWLPAPFLSFSVTPTTVRAQEPGLTATSAAVTRSGLTDLPLEATLAKSFAAAYSPSISASLGVTLPIGDTASGLGSGEVGYSLSGGVGFVPAEHWSVNVGAGRSLTRFSTQAAFSSGTGWGDASVGYAFGDRLSISTGMSSDLGAVDSTLGRSRSFDGGASIVVGGGRTINMNVSHGVSGSAPGWSFALGFGTAFPYLNHVGARSADASLANTFGAGTHGLPGVSKGSGKGSGTTTKTTRGRGRSGG